VPDVMPDDCMGCVIALARARSSGAWEACDACGAQHRAPALEARARCPGCVVALAVARALPGREITCRECPARFLARHASLPAAPRARGPRRAPRGDDGQRLRAFALDVLGWHRTVERAERAAHGEASPLLGVLRVLELGVLGTGCRGTKGVGGRPASAADVPGADPIGAARYRALGRAHQATVDAIIADGHGDALVDVPFGAVVVRLDLEQRVGLRLASARDVTRWTGKITSGDSRPARAGMADVGGPALRAAAAAWWAALGDEDDAAGAPEKASERP